MKRLDVVNLIVHGWPMREIGMKYGVSRQRVWQWLVADGLTVAEVKRQAEGGRNLTHHMSVRAEGLFFCYLCHELKDRETDAFKNGDGGVICRCKECNRKSTRRYYHEGNGKAVNRIWLEEKGGREKQRGYCRKYHQSDKGKAANLRWRTQNAARVLELRQKYYQEHREAILARMKQYYQEHKK